MKKLLAITNLILSFNAFSMSNFGEFKGYSEIFINNLPQSFTEAVGGEEELAETNNTPRVFIEGINSSFFENLVDKAIKKSSQGHPHIHVMYGQYWLDDIDEKSLSPEQKKFFSHATANLNGAYIQIDLENSNLSLTCERKYDVDIKKMEFSSRIGCFFPAPENSGLKELIESNNFQLNYFNEEQIAGLMTGVFPESIKTDKKVLELVNRYGELFVPLMVSSKKYGDIVEAMITDGKIIMRAQGRNLAYPMQDMIPLETVDKDKVPQNLRYLENTTFLKNETGETLCYKKEGRKSSNSNMLLIETTKNPLTGKSELQTSNFKTEHACIYSIDISKYLNQLL